MKTIIDILESKDIVSFSSILEKKANKLLENQLEVLEEAAINKALDEATPTLKVKVNSKGQRTKKRKCPAGFKLQGTSCVALTSSEKQTKKLAIKKSLRTKKANATASRKARMRQSLAMKKRKKQGL